MGFFKLLFSFEGRINRGTWWLCGLIFMVIKFILDAVFSSLLGAGDQPALGALPTKAQLAAACLSSLILLYPMLAVGAKRMHDRNKSGWRIAAFMVPALLLVALMPALAALSAGGSAAVGLAGTAIVLTILTLIAVIWNVVECGFLNGTPGDNDYGPPHRLADIFGYGEERDSKWASAIDMSAHVAPPTAASPSIQATQSVASRKAAKPSAAKPSGFGRRMPARA